MKTKHGKSTAKKPAPNYENRAQRIVHELGIKSIELARAAGANSVSGGNWRAGRARPRLGARVRIEKAWPQIQRGLWDIPPSGELPSDPVERERWEQRTNISRGVGSARAAPALPTRAGEALSSGQSPTRPGTADAGAGPEETQEQESAAERRARVSMQLRTLERRAREAVEALTDAERVTAHAGFRRMREELLEILECDKALHSAMRAVLPEPDPSGAAARLRQVRTELETLMGQLERESARLLDMRAIQRANQVQGQWATADKLLARAKLARADVKELCGLKVWQVISYAAGEVLRPNREALDCCASELAASEEPFARAMGEALRGVGQISWPSERYQKDLVGFFEDILGVYVHRKMREMLLLIQDNDWTAIRSGHRVSKSLSLAGVAWWFYSSFELARVFITAPTEKQLTEVAWYEIKVRRLQSGVCLRCKDANAAQPNPVLRVKAPCPHSAKIEGEQKEKPKGGVHSEDARQITGFTSKDAEGAQGLAGSNIMFLVDEASGVGRAVFLALKGNLSGGGKLVLFGNPTRGEGEFFDAFHKLKKHKGKGYYATLTISSLDSPNVTGERNVPGLATLQWCEDRKEEWGEDSADYKIRVLGVHATESDGRLFSVAMITEAEARWSLEDQLADGPLVIGVDPAGAEGSGDDSGFAARRGQKILRVRTERKLDDDGHLGVVLELIAQYGEPGELVTVNVDSEGVGSGTLGRIRQYAASQPGALRAFGVRSSNNARIEPNVYDKVRTELSAQFARWVRAGGAIPTDVKLQAEMRLHELQTKLTAQGERLQVTPKKLIQKEIRRSPDRYDACCLACWPQAQEWADEVPAAPETPPRERGGALDPYAGASGGGQIDPYA